MSVDSVGDFLTIIRNGVLASKPVVTTSYSNFKYQIARILLQEGFIKEVTVEPVADKPAFRILRVVLKYINNESVIHEITRMSKPSRRSYVGHVQSKPVIGGLGISILTTNRGVMTNKQARIVGVGGELICTVW
jgi:small subunit ribosomal protein S8